MHEFDAQWPLKMTMKVTFGGNTFFPITDPSPSPSILHHHQIISACEYIKIFVLLHTIESSISEHNASKSIMGLKPRWKERYTGERTQNRLKPDRIVIQVLSCTL